MNSNQETQQLLNDAQKLAFSLDHEFLTLEHIFSKIIEKPIVIEMFKELEINLDEIRENIDNELKKEYQIKTLNKKNPRTTESVQSLIQMFQIHIQNYGHKYDGILLLLFSFYSFPESFSTSNMIQYGLTKEVFVNYINSPNQTQEKTNLTKEEDPTKTFLLNLNEKVKQNKIDPVIGRESEINRLVHVLLRKKKNNPLLVGEPGVGKTAIAEGLAYKIVNNTIHAELKDHTVYALDIGALTAGTKFRGDFEDRLKKVLNKLKSNPKNILFIDEIHTIIGAGSSGSGSMDVSNLIKPELANGEIKCIGSTTYKEFRNFFEKDGALTRRFQKIDVDEPTIEDSKKILFGIKPFYEKFHGISYSNESINLAVELSAKYITDKFLPDKAIDLIDEAGALCKLESKDNVVNKDMIEKILTKIAKIPEKQVLSTEKEKLTNLSSNLENIIFGQKEAVESLVNSILLNKSGLREVNKPIGSFLFCGPTGVGKTELSKQLAINLGISFTRIDMSEYMDKFNASKLIGAPPGYIGYEQDGVLTGAVSKNPHSVILLDEIEKAHPEIWNFLLQIMDNGFLMDNFGKKIDFRNVILIMTSNVGVDEIQNTKTIGIAQINEITKPVSSIEKTFSPEFRNRLDSIIWFNSLNEITIRNVLDKNLSELDMMLAEKSIVIEYSNEVKDWLCKKGYNPMMGARPMSRLIQDKIKSPLSKEIIFGKLENGGSVNVNLKNNDLVFEFNVKNKRKTKKLTVKS